MKKKSLVIASAAILVAAIVVFASVKIRGKHFHRVNPAFRTYIAGFTSGTISSESVIRIQLEMDVVDTLKINKEVSEEVFSFSPSIAGKAFWVDRRTIEFRPKEKLSQGEMYDAKFYLSRVLEVPDSMKTFEFQFRIMKQAFEVNFENLESYDKKKYNFEKLTGSIFTADAADGKDVEKILDAEQNGLMKKITWFHDADKRTHRFQIDSLVRGVEPGNVKVRWNGDAIDVNTSGEKIYEIPALDVFKFITAVANQEQEQFIELTFSDPIREDQNLEGLITIAGSPNPKIQINNNQILIYPSTELRGYKNISIDASIENTQGKKLGIPIGAQVVFEDISPALKLIGKGVIVPSTNGMTFPFEAVNLAAVDVKIEKIFENNIGQFLQINSLDGDYDMHQCAQTIVKKTVVLAQNVINRWGKYSLDLSDYVKDEPGAIYRISVSFKKDYSTYRCGGKPMNEGKQLANTTWSEEEKDADDDEEEYEYYGYWGDDYHWEKRQDPCESSYYSYSSRSFTRNVLISNLGIIAKRGSDKMVNIYVTDIVSTDPLSGVEIEVYDYQRQLLGKVLTNGDGMAAIQLKKSPFLIIAKKDKQRGYLKMDDGSALSVSMYDVAGEKIKKGIKGFIYGERGVWRPGDSLYLSFILEDKANTLPKSHPVAFQLLNPQGQVVRNIIKSTAINNVYTFATNTDISSPTGNWTAQVRVGGILFTKKLKIETVKPNRLKINLNFPGNKLFKDTKGSMAVKWLHGAVAHNLKAEVSVILTQSKAAFDKYPNYCFEDPASGFEPENFNVFTGNIDDNGNATIDPKITIKTAAPGVLKAYFDTKVFEDGGGFSIDRFSVPYYSYTSYLGMSIPDESSNSKILYTGKDHVINVVDLDCDGKLVGPRKIRMDIYKMEWRWWWDNYEDNSSNYISTSNQHLLRSQEYDLNGKKDLNLYFKDDEWGRYLIRITDLESGHKTGKVIYVDSRDWYSRSHNENSSVSMLSFSSDKEKYKVGDKASLKIPTSAGGRALITIETGSRVLASYWVETKKDFTEFSFPITSEMAPNIYANVTFIQKHAQTLNDLPIRLYGIIPIMVEDPKTHLKPIIKMADVLKPEQNAVISIKEESGKAMTYTLAIVDEGLLDLTRFKTPDPWVSFYAREALGVKSWDLYEYVMGAYNGELQRVLSIGGDGEGLNKAGMKANRFKPMVKYLGPFVLGKGETKTHTILMPQYIGSVRVMVVASQEGAYGNAEKSVAVRKPLMLLGTLPRVVGPGESVKLPVTIFAMEKNIKNVNVQVITNELFKVNGGNSKTTTFNQIGDNMLAFDLKVADATGVGKVKIVATSGKERAEYDIEIDVRNPNPKVTNITDMVVKAGTTWVNNFTTPGVTGTNRGILEISSIPPINLDKRLQYLIQYPHGCIEQTTSAVFPQLYVNAVVDVEPELKARMEKNIKAAIQQLRSFQLTNGGMAYWQEETNADEWGTSYAGHFMIEASNKGYSLPVGFLDNWKRYQKLMANNWMANGSRTNNDLVQAYRLYTLALAKSPEFGAMNRLKENKTLSMTARWRLAAAYQLAGQTEVAKAIIKGLPMTTPKYRELSMTYGSNERDDAMILETLSLLKMNTQAMAVFKNISSSLSKDSWMSTQATAYSLIAVTGYIKSVGFTSEVKCNYKINEKQAVIIDSKHVITQANLGLKGLSQKGKIQIVNLGKGALYVRVILEGVPTTGDKSATKSDLKMDVVYKTMTGAALDPTQLAQGTDFMAEVTVTNPGLRGNYSNLALSQVFPSGWEIHNVRLSDGVSAVKSSAFSYQDIRDDRVYTYFDLLPNASKTYIVLLNASYLGKFYLPTLYCEAMYDNSINARILGRWVEVVPNVKPTLAMK